MTTLTEDILPHDGIGSRIGPYELTREAGRGGAATVFEARDTRIGRRVAVKVVRMPSYLSMDQREEMSQRLMREARAAGRLSHPNIVTMHDVGAEGDLLYLVMEFLDGETLHERLRRGALPPEDAAGIATQLASALEAVHDAGLLHRDIKPGNVMILPGGQIKLMDFGIARHLDETMLTQAGSFVGTPAYMSPEQCRGADASAASDTWAVGVLLYQMLAGHRPFEGATIPSVMYQVTHEDPPPIAGLAEPVRQTVQRALDKDPARRFPSPTQLAEAFRSALLESPEAATMEAEPETVWAKTVPQRRMLKPWPTVAAAAVLLGALGIGAAHLRKPSEGSHVVIVTHAAPGASVTVTAPTAMIPAKAAASHPAPPKKHAAPPKKHTKAKKSAHAHRKVKHRRRRGHASGRPDFFAIANQLIRAYGHG